ncbi:MAG: CheY-like chemotaxis protein [Myxococcota bacterium]|jgi:CheY-like chemotaxis protein
MLIDDEEADNFLHGLVLRESGTVNEVIDCSSAIDALVYLKRPEGHKIDVIFLDINMPLMNGFEFLEEYAALPMPCRARAVVVMLTTSLRPEDQKRARERGLVADFLPKPLTAKNVERVFSALAG